MWRTWHVHVRVGEPDLLGVPGALGDDVGAVDLPEEAGEGEGERDVEDEEAPLPLQVESMKQPNPSGQLEAV